MSLKDELTKKMKEKTIYWLAIRITALFFIAQMIYVIRALFHNLTFMMILIGILPILVALEAVLAFSWNVRSKAKKNKNMSKEEISAEAKNNFILACITGVPICFISTTIAILVLTNNELLFNTILIVTLLYSIFCTVSALYKYIRYRDKYVSKQNRKFFLVIMAASLAINIAFFYNIGNIYKTVASTERQAVGWRIIYNQDGSIRHNQDGSIDEEIVYETKYVYSQVFNFSLLLYPLANIGLLYVLVKKEGLSEP